MFGKTIFALLLAAALLTGDVLTATVAGAGPLRRPTLVGVIVNAENPAASSAIIDGRVIRVGELHQGMRLTEVHRDHVKLVDEGSGQTFALGFATASKVDDLSESIPSPDQIPPARPRAEEGSGPTIAAPVAAGAQVEEGWLASLNPMRLVWIAYTVMAQASLRQIHTAQQMYAVQDLDHDGHDHFTPSLVELGYHHLVQEDLAGGEKFGYRFALRSWEDRDGPHFECFADPVSGNGDQPYLYLDESGVIRGQMGARAGFNSPPYEAGLF